MYNPPHPGEILRLLGLEPLGLSVTKTAKALDVSRSALSSLLHGRTSITPEMALRLSIAFDTTPESWMNQQVQYDVEGEAASQQASRDPFEQRGTSCCVMEKQPKIEGETF